MKKNDLLENGSRIIRVLNVKEDKALVIDCINRTMPRWENCSSLVGYVDCNLEKMEQVTER